MGSQRRDPGTWLRKVLNPQEMEGAAVQLSPEDANNNAEVAKEGGVFHSWRFRGKWHQANKVMIVAVAVMLASGARYIMSRKAQSYLKRSELPLDDVSVEKYMEDLDKALWEMESAWENAEFSVQQAFQIHFTPSLEDGQELLEDPLATIKDHVDKIQECEISSVSSMEARRGFAQHLQLLLSICRTVTLRLDELESYVSANKIFDVPVPVPDHGEPSSDPAPEEHQGMAERDWTASDFLVSFGLFGGDSERTVDKHLCNKLASALEIEKKFNDSNSKARHYFIPSLEPFGGDGALNPAHAPAEHQIPYTKRPFRTGALAQAAAHIFRESDATMYNAYIQKLSRIANNWTDKGVLLAAEQQEKENANKIQNRLKTKREQMRLLLKKGIPKDDLVMSALFLL
ncbi:uncharacterized protein EMH_0053410 [Eimeria mitis]|uniref:Uncharacterized protein n=1 Tax=Eimeria mitis TaxID=44415 RepID=U6JWQ4_9EIME|nr:uncharacterized protein EMH_0053410 [Eimeria mitis]CDJ29890.1 hypothetical protein EMH_0053410 [Eimeria mitis]